MSARDDKVEHQGSCHCGAIRFRVHAPAWLTVESCNCSMCNACAFLHLIVPAADLHAAPDNGRLLSYTFNTGTARHLFCAVCGVKPYYVPRSNPTGYSVNARCLQPDSIAGMTVRPFDGRNFEHNVGRLAGLAGES